MPKKPKAMRRTSDDPDLYLELKLEEWLQEGEEAQEALLPHFPEAASMAVELPPERSQDPEGYREVANLILAQFYSRDRMQDFREWLRETPWRVKAEATLPEVLEQGI